MKEVFRNGSTILKKEVLVLNQNYHPLHVCTIKRAICLMFLDKVEVIEHYRDSIHTPTNAFKLPSVIKLNRYITFKNGEVVLNRKNILKRDNHQCQYCGRKSIPMTIDHVIPRERNGTDSWTNLVCCCHSCNKKKGNMTPEDAEMKLLRTPRKPNRIHYIQQFVKKEQDNWRPYLYM